MNMSPFTEMGSMATKSRRNRTVIEYILSQAKDLIYLDKKTLRRVVDSCFGLAGGILLSLKLNRPNLFYLLHLCIAKTVGGHPN